MKKFLFEHSLNVFSEKGEDGIIEAIFKHLKINSGVVLEIGAWDGFLGSNCANLWSKNKEYKGILIECDRHKLDVDHLTSTYDNIECYVELVSSTNTLERIISGSKFEVTNDNFVLASIDVDGDDLNVAESLGKYNPVVIILEPNGNIFEDLNPEGVKVSKWIEWCDKRGYSFIGSSGFLNADPGNLFFIRNDLKSKFPITKLNWEDRGLLKNDGSIHNK